MSKELGGFSKAGEAHFGRHAVKESNFGGYEDSSQFGTADNMRDKIGDLHESVFMPFGETYIVAEFTT